LLEKHLHRYLAEFDFRYSNRIALGVDDQDRAERRKGARSIVPDSAMLARKAARKRLH
jgi:hypothetical protein